MAFPEELPLIPITGRVQGIPDGAACTVTFAAPAWLNSSIHDVIVPPFTEPVSAPGGTVAISLPPNNHPDWTSWPANWNYAVTVQYGHQFLKATMNVPYDAVTLDISDMLVFNGPAVPPGNNYVQTSQIGAPGGVAPLGGDSKVPAANLPAAFSGAVILTEQAAPAPAADKITMYAIDIDGNTVPRMMLPEGIELDPIRDTSFVVRNASGATIPAGTPVYATGIHPGSGNIPTVAPAQANVLQTSVVIGLMLESVANNAYGRLMQQGRLNNINTIGLTTGAPLYLSPAVAGGLVTSPPAHPNYTVPVGVAMRVHATSGSIAVQITSIEGNEQGTAQNAFVIGNGQAGAKSVGFRNGFSSTLQANPTAARTWSLPDVNGTLATTGQTSWGPEDHGLSGWTFDPGEGVFGALLLPAAGVIKVARVRLMKPVLTNIILHFTVGGSALSNCYVAAYNDAGALLGPGAVSADQSTSWQSGGTKIVPLNTPMAVVPGDIYRLAWWWGAGTTAPTQSRGSNSGSAIINVNQSAGTARFATANSGVGASAPANLASLAGDSTAWWVGAS